jgi:para-aminobenzoate synthetase component 1
VNAFPELETYSSVHHLVATIQGERRRDRTMIDLIQATFPGGSITGAPKIRAMQIIDELEPVTRGVYTGSIGYLGFNGSADLNIAIRTIIVKDGIAYVHAGGGIVAESEEVDEYEEAILKARRLVDAINAV